jgi:eukaryotic-like serine/threonine-protein kinase
MSRDGKRMIYEARVDEGRLQRLAFDAQKEALVGGPVTLYEGSMYLRYPAMSPDGKSLAFTGRAPYEDVYVAAADGTGLRQLTNDIARERGIAWWPDGSRILFYSNRDGQYQAWTIRPDGSGLTQLTQYKEGVNFPRVSPDGRFLVFVTDSGSSGGIVRIDGPLPVTRYDPLPNPSDGRFFPRSWSPNGAWVAGGTFGQSTLHLLQVATRKLTTLPIRARGAAFIDDRRVLFIDADDRVGILDANTQQARFIGTLPSEPGSSTSYGSISVDATSILVYRVRTQGDLWLATHSE